MRCATCKEYYEKGGCQHSSLTLDFQTLAFCGTACYVQFLSTQPYRKKNDTMSRASSSGRKDISRWVS